MKIMTPDEQGQRPLMINRYRMARENMIRTHLIPRGIHDPMVLQAMREIPRERFVPGPIKQHAYDDSALAIGNGQTISQPYIIALMTEALGLREEEKTLEIATGSGYQVAILAELSKGVYSVERIQPLLKRAKKLWAN